jgi:hypothetical protein
MDELFYQFASDCCEERPKGWFTNTKRLIKVFTDLIQDEQWVLRPISDGEHENALLHQIERFIVLNDEALGAFSLPSLAILWVSESLLLGRINRKTARDYLNGLTLRTGLRHSMAHDMRLWDEECVEEMLESIEIRDLRPSTKAAVIAPSPSCATASST